MLAFLDIETTSLDTATAEIVELAVSIGDEMRVRRYKPSAPIPPEASAVHGIRDEDVALCGSPADDEAMWALAVRTDSYLVGHNILEYDLPILQRQLPGVFGGFSRAAGAVIDTLRLARHLWPDIPSHSLQALRHRFCYKPIPGWPHSAAFDVIGTQHLFEYMNLGADLAAIVARCLEPIKVTQMYFGKHKGEKLSDVPPDYLGWLFRQPWLKSDHPDLYHTLRK